MGKQQSTPLKYSPIDGFLWDADAMTGQEYRRAHPNAPWRFNPWTGDRRDPRDVESDPKGHLIVPPNEPVYAAPDCPHAGCLNPPAPIERALADMVNHPSHYTGGKVECIDALEAATHDLTGLEAVCTANAIKYLWRWKRKGGHEDLRKARWYINRLLGDTP